MGYYFIAIGGSGAKVMESLTHLCVAGLLPNKEKQEKLYVMAIDPDIGNGNLKRSSAALHNFEQFQDAEVGMGTPLFKTGVELANPFIWNPTEHDKKLDDIMSYQVHKGTPLGSLYEVLYTREERNTFLNEGFRGRPSIGAAVLAKRVALKEQGEWAADSAPWDKFSHLVQQDAKSGQAAKIFLASSVFGGTGAAGMPTIARLLRNTFGNYYEEGKVMIGGVLILPYFSFAPELSDTEGRDMLFASSENFLTNTKAALKYYALKENIYHSMYFIGDDILSPVKKFSIGASTQNNDAHIVDLYGALAAIDFFQSTRENAKRYSYIAHGEENVFRWADLPAIRMDGEVQVRIKERLVQFTRFVFAYVHIVKPVLADLASGKLAAYKYPWFADYLSDVNMDDPEIKNFNEYAESFVRWLHQLESTENHRGVELIHPNSFGADPARIDPEMFASCSYDENSDLTIHELWYRLAERPCRDKENARGFGRFLRVLYDCCAKEEEDG